MNTIQVILGYKEVFFSYNFFVPSFRSYKRFAVISRGGTISQPILYPKAAQASGKPIKTILEGLIEAYRY